MVSRRKSREAEIQTENKQEIISSIIIVTLRESQQKKFPFRKLLEEKRSWNCRQENQLMFLGSPVFSRINACIHRS